MTMSRVVIRTVFITVVLSACEKEVDEPPERIRAVKTIVVIERASGETRQFPGVIEPVETSSISSEVSGIVQEVNVDAGDAVNAGQVLAVLDRKPFELIVASAKAGLSRAQAQVDEAKSNYDRERRIYAQDSGATTEKSVERARAGYESKRQSVNYARAQLDLARRDLEKTALLAPFEGTVAARDVEPFEEVRRGQSIFELYSEGAMQVAVQVPENMIEDVYVGQPAAIRLPTLGDLVLHGAVTEVSSAARGANAFPVKATIGASDSRIRPGITAELSLLLPGQFDQDAYHVPVTALAPGEDQSSSSLFVFDPATSTVHRIAVVNRGLVGDLAAIAGEIGPGDIVVVAGVSFLSDGQKVKLLETAPPASGG
jgi:RND family efflux transporter MFP subunit